jgi:uncharacterized membrane protein
MRKVRLLILLLLIIWNAGNFIQLLALLNSKFLLLFPILKPTYHLVCHQQADKLINIAGVTTLLCARCSGIYIGGLIGAIFLILRIKPFRLPTKYLLYASIPMFIDVALVLFGVYNYSKPIAFSTGVLLGSVGIVYLTDLIEKFLFLERSKKE